MHYVKTGDGGRIAAVVEPPDIQEDWTDEEREAVWACYEDMIQMELPDDFDFDHIGRYSLADGGTLTDHGYEPPKETQAPDYEERITNVETRTDALETATDDMILLMADLIGGN